MATGNFDCDSNKKLESYRSGASITSNHLQHLTVVLWFLQHVLEGGEGPLLPAARVVPSQGELLWLLDEPAAASLSLQVQRPPPGAEL